MSKVISSPVEKFPGTVTIPDQLPLPLYAAWEECLIKSRDYRGWTSIHIACLPGILQIVEKWDIEGLPANPAADKFPVRKARELLVWLVNEITYVFNADSEIPND